jgi:hypothetical protein
VVTQEAVVTGVSQLSVLQGHTPVTVTVLRTGLERILHYLLRARGYTCQKYVLVVLDFVSSLASSRYSSTLKTMNQLRRSNRVASTALLSDPKAVQKHDSEQGLDSETKVQRVIRPELGATSWDKMAQGRSSREICLQRVPPRSAFSSCCAMCDSLGG